MKITDTTLYHGRPADESGRLAKEIRTYDLLDSLKIDYLRLDHEAIYNMEECEERGEILGISICKNVFLTNAQKNRFILLMMPATKRYKTAVFSKLAESSRLSFAPEEFMKEYLDCTPGSASVMGLMNDRENHVELFIDADVIKADFIGCHPCINTSSIKLKTSDLLEKYLPAVRHGYKVVELPSDA